MFFQVSQFVGAWEDLGRPTKQIHKSAIIKGEEEWKETVRTPSPPRYDLFKLGVKWITYSIFFISMFFLEFFSSVMVQSSIIEMFVLVNLTWGKMLFFYLFIFVMLMAVTSKCWLLSGFHILLSSLSQLWFLCFLLLFSCFNSLNICLIKVLIVLIIFVIIIL